MEIASSLQTLPASAPARRLPLPQALTLFALLAIVVVAFVVGVQLRRWAFNYTQPIRFWPDITRGFRFGARAIDEGYFNVYDNVARQRPDGNYELDYAPLRLLVMRQWAVQARKTFPGATEWNADPQTTYAFNRPVLRFNTGVEVMTAIGVFLLTWWWVRRPRRLSWWASLMPAVMWRPLLAALVIWFSPAQILSAQCWTTWDCWIVPFYVWAVLLACLDWWFAAGLVIGVGAMLKGQQFFVAPLFILWPLLQGRLGAPARWLCGVAMAFTLIASPWLLADLRRYLSGGSSFGALCVSPPIRWIGGAVAACALFALPELYRRLRSIYGKNQGRRRLPTPLHEGRWPWRVDWATRGARLACAACALALLVWPWWRAQAVNYRPWALLAATGVVAAGWLLPLRKLPFLAAAVLSAAIVSCVVLFPGSSLNWFYISFGYGTRHWETMTMGLTSNLPAILRDHYRWYDLHTVACTIPPHALWLWPAQPLPVSLKYLLFSIYIVTLVLCALGTAMHHRRGDARFLVAITAPWLLFFTLLGQIHERYLLYAAGVGATLIAVNCGLLLIDLFMAVLTWAMTIHVMLNVGMGMASPPDAGVTVMSPQTRGMLLRIVSGQHPDIGWAVMLCAAIFLYLSLMPRRRIQQGES
jgi:hypothetical protein